VLGINFARDGMAKKDWVALCAVHADAWLFAVAFFFAARFDDAGRAQLFSLVNQHPTVYEVATGRAPRGKVHKRRALVGGRVAVAAAEAAAAEAAAVPAAAAQAETQREVPVGRVATPADVGPALVGRQCEMYWPDDSTWYLVEVTALDPATREATVLYKTGEVETLVIDEAVRDEHLRLL
jgi:hypothetical protein